MTVKADDSAAARDDYRYLLVLYPGILVPFVGFLVYSRLALGWTGEWRTDALVVALIALIFQSGIALMLARVARRTRTKVMAYVLALSSFAALFLVPYLFARLRE